MTLAYMEGISLLDLVIVAVACIVAVVVMSRLSAAFRRDRLRTRIMEPGERERALRFWLNERREDDDAA